MAKTPDYPPRDVTPSEQGGENPVLKEALLKAREAFKAKNGEDHTLAEQPGESTPEVEASNEKGYETRSLALTERLSEMYGDRPVPAGLNDMLSRLKTNNEREKYLAHYVEEKNKYLGSLDNFRNENKAQPSIDNSEQIARLEEHLDRESISDEVSPVEPEASASVNEVPATAEETSAVPEVIPAEEDLPEEALSPKAWREWRDSARVSGESLPSMTANSAEALDNERAREAGSADRTPQENRKFLKELITSAKEKFGWYSSSSENLINRSKELDAELSKETSKLEGGMRWLGEKYNKLGWKSKLAVGLGLGVGAGAFSVVSMPAAFACMSGLAVQRAAGLSTMFLKFEKKTLEGKWQKEKALGLAMLYTLGMFGVMHEVSAAAKELTEYALQHEWGTAIKEWVGNVRGFTHSPSTPAAPLETQAPGADDVYSASFDGSPAEAVTRPDALYTSSFESPSPEALPPMPEMPSVEATPGHGYEYMLKRLYEELHANNVRLPENAGDSDLAKLIAADDTTIDQLVHDLAKSPTHGFFNADGTSVRIDPGAQMTIDSSGNIRLNGEVHAPMNAPATPSVAETAPAPEPAPTPVEAAPTPEPEVASTFEPAPVPETVHDVDIQDSPAPEVENITSSLDKPIVPFESTPEAIPAPDAPFRPEVGPEQLPEVTLQSPEGMPAMVDTSQIEHSTIPAPTESIVNHFGIEVIPSEAHIYADKAGHIFAYGGSIQEKMKAVGDFLTQNPDKTIYATDDNGNYRIPWRLINEKFTPGGPIRTNGFLGLGGRFMKGPDISEFKEIIK